MAEIERVGVTRVGEKDGGGREGSGSEGKGGRNGVEGGRRDPPPPPPPPRLHEGPRKNSPGIKTCAGAQERRYNRRFPTLFGFTVIRRVTLLYLAVSQSLLSSRRTLSLALPPSSVACYCREPSCPGLVWFVLFHGQELKVLLALGTLSRFVINKDV